MGNWRTVNIVGTCDAADLPALGAAVNIGDDWDRFHCLCNPGPSICGLGDWTGATIDARGNLAERDYRVEDVAKALEKLVAVAPSLTVRVHCGDDYEDATCVATVVAEDGAVSIDGPQVPAVATLGEGEMAANMFAALLGARRV